MVLTTTESQTASWTYNAKSEVSTTVGNVTPNLAGAGDSSPLMTGDVRHVVASPAFAAAELGFRAAVPMGGVAHCGRAALRR